MSRSSSFLRTEYRPGSFCRLPNLGMYMYANFHKQKKIRFVKFIICGKFFGKMLKTIVFDKTKRSVNVTCLHLADTISHNHNFWVEVLQSHLNIFVFPKNFCNSLEKLQKVQKNDEIERKYHTNFV